MRALSLVLIAVAAGTWCVATSAPAQQATRDAAERIRRQAEQRDRDAAPPQQGRPQQGQPQRGGPPQEADADDQSAQSSGVSPAQGVIERKLARLADVKSQPPRDKTTYVRGPDGKAQVARVMCELEDQRMVKLSDGRLDFVRVADTRPCDRPFRSASMSQIESQMRSEGFSEFTFERDGYYLYAYNCSEGFYQHTRSILGTMLAGVVEQLREWGLKVQRPQTPLVVVIFPDRASFDRHEKMPPEVAAYYSPITNWVYLYENTDLWDAAPEYAMKEYAYTVAHEGIHQVLHNTGIQQRLSKWPAWISEGLPEYFCPLNVSSKVVRQGKSQMPERVLKWQSAGRVNDLRMYHLLRGAPGGSGRLVQEAISYHNLTAYGYAVSWGITHYLSQRKSSEFAAYLRDLSKLRPLQGGLLQSTHTADPLFVKHFGEDYEDLEQQIKRHLNSSRIQRQYTDPVANQSVYLVKRIYIKSRVSYTRAVISWSPSAARQWRDQEEKRMEDMGEEAAFYTIICDDINEARYQLAKIMN